ncbi:hypothetical protein M406DRAFT_64535 [Cryphonectria parasitica EP155]|uniref:Uncharacterized protein n=1 Tax=Cryphonectria parasitica (strain ATCC 38755 / EP155) TaxID=660469 RepID=A0A9P5CLR8_CRYP1|nr:uncharacterized protein M406DRAFT_64535 [Cryphonectria parasitica EP155]KAF3763609.1 hypothetical protein M406DRAFT_64535 [Cryphonectria parasitica EP155]
MVLFSAALAAAASLSLLPQAAVAAVNISSLPAPEAVSTLVVLVMHAQTDYWAFPPCTELAARGFTVLCANNAASKLNMWPDADLEFLMQNVAEMVGWIRNQTEFSKIVLWGHSGGGCLMSAYQNIAENGISACNGTEKIWPCGDEVAGLPPADGVILHDANYGLSTMMFLSLNAAIINETTLETDPSLDMYSATNGFNTSGPSNFSETFMEDWQTALVERNNRLISHAEDRWTAIINNESVWADEEGFLVADAAYGEDNNKIFAEDLKYLSHTTNPWPLIHNNGSITTEIVYSVRVSESPTSDLRSYINGALKTTVGRFLRIFALRVEDDFAYEEDDLRGIVWNSSHLVPRNEVRGISVPLLTMGNTGHWEYLNAEKEALAHGGNDTTTAFVEGASHLITPCTECETYPGEYNNTVKNAFDFQATWLAKPGRFF